MKPKSAAIWFFVGTIVCLLAAQSTPAQQRPKPNDKKPQRPAFNAVIVAVEEELKTDPNYQPGFIISRSDVTKVFKKLDQIGWKVPQSQEVMGLVLEDDNFLVKHLRTKVGRKFMQDVDKYPNAYDRLDRMWRMPYGKSAVSRLIQGPGGDWMIQYMTEDSGGKALGDQLSNTPTGRDFNKPTGRIYTADALVVALKTIYDHETKAASTPARPGKRNSRGLIGSSPE